MIATDSKIPDGWNLAGSSIVLENMQEVSEVVKQDEMYVQLGDKTVYHSKVSEIKSSDPETELSLSMKLIYQKLECVPLSLNFPKSRLRYALKEDDGVCQDDYYEKLGKVLNDDMEDVNVCCLFPENNSSDKHMNAKLERKILLKSMKMRASDKAKIQVFQKLFGDLMHTNTMRFPFNEIDNFWMEKVQQQDAAQKLNQDVELIFDRDGATPMEFMAKSMHEITEDMSIFEKRIHKFKIQSNALKGSIKAERDVLNKLRWTNKLLKIRLILQEQMEPCRLCAGSGEYLVKNVLTTCLGCDGTGTFVDYSEEPSKTLQIPTMDRERTYPPIEKKTVKSRKKEKKSKSNADRRHLKHLMMLKAKLSLSQNTAFSLPYGTFNLTRSSAFPLGDKETDMSYLDSIYYMEQLHSQVSLRNPRELSEVFNSISQFSKSLYQEANQLNTKVSIKEIPTTDVFTVKTTESMLHEVDVYKALASMKMQPMDLFHHLAQKTVTGRPIYVTAASMYRGLQEKGIAQNIGMDHTAEFIQHHGKFRSFLTSQELFAVYRSRDFTNIGNLRCF